MENIKIQFKGITRNTDDGISADGECMELINARVNNSSIEPIGKPIMLKQTAHTYSKIYHHSIAKRYIGITESGQMYEMPEDLSSETIMTGDLKAKSIEFIGNTISVITDEGIRYILFRNGSYIYLGEIPDVPEFGIDKEVKAVSVEIDEISDNDDEVRYGNFTKVLSEANKNGCYCYSAAFCAAFRLFDGSYIKSTEIQIIFLDSDDSVTITYGDRNNPQNIELSGGYSNQFFAQTNSNGVMKAHILCFKPSFFFEEYDFSAWSDIIIGIEIFSTDNFRTRLQKDYFGVYISQFEMNCKKPIERANNISLMYNITSLKLGETKKSVDIDVSIDNLATLPHMVDSFNTHHSILPKSSYSYNNRLHLIGIKRTLSSGVRVSSTAKEYQFLIHIYIHASDGDKVIEKWEIGQYIRTFIMYPDSRAYKMIIYRYEYNVPVVGIQIDLKKSDYFDFSFYCKEYEYERGSVKQNTGFFDVIKISDFESMEVGETTDNMDYEKGNVMYVSNLNNPFFFPADQVYQFNTDIVGVQSNVVALSQGQFGQFPLYVFTKDGIYAMNVGSGEVAYSNQTPVTRDVCNNPDSICGLDTMVAFSTDRGLMVINGTVTELISEKIYGFLPSCSVSSPIIVKILDVASLGDDISSVVFPDYIEEAKIGYNYEAKEIVVANMNFPYSYVYSLKTGEWHKISQNIDSFVNSYPYTWAVSGNQILDLNNTHRSVSTIALISRPIKMGTLTHKRILQTALRGIVKRSLSDLYIKGEPVMFRGDTVDIFSDVGMYVLASNDAEHFELVAKKEKMADIRDLVTKMNKSRPYKYFMVCLVGGVRTDVSINYIEMNVDESFTNRLR